MEFAKILVLSTAHLHPLEGPKIDDVAYIHSDICSLVNVEPSMDEYYTEEGFPCLVDLVRLVRTQYSDVTYIMFDPDANVEDEFRKFDW